MKVISTKLPGVLVLEPKVHGDHRGFYGKLQPTNIGW